MRFLGLETPLFIAHRGASALAPENTLASFRLAIQAGMELAECDVRRTREGRLVVMHDATVDRTTDGTGRVSDLTLEQIKSLDAGVRFGEAFRGERVPTFEQFLEQVVGSIRPVVELNEDGLGAQVVAALREHCALEEALAVSFRPAALEEMQRMAPELATGYLYGDDTPMEQALAQAESLGARMLGPWEGLIAAGLVAEAHRRNLVVQAWTVDDRERMAQLLALGVDVIATNVPLSAEERLRFKPARAAESPGSPSAAILRPESRPLPGGRERGEE